MTGVKRKLFGGFFVFGTMAIFEIASAIMLVNSVGSQDQDFDPCDMLESSGSRLRFVISCVVLTLLWTIGLFCDPIFTLTFDPLFSESVTRHSIHTSRVIFDWMGFYLSAGFFGISGILNIYFLATASFAYYYFSEEIRKHYVFVLSRCLSSILAVISLITIQTTQFAENFNLSFTFYAIAFSIYNFSMDSLLLSYIMISVITYFGVVHSSFYYRKVTLRSLYVTLCVIWIFSFSIAIPLSIYQAASSASGGPIRCDVEHCAKVIQWITFSFACVALLVTIFLTGFVVLSLYWYHFKAAKNGIQVPEVTSRARVRLSWTFLALVVFCFVELFPVGMLIGYDRRNLGTCENFYEADKLLVQTVISASEALLVSIVFMADPIINIFFDKNISKIVKLQDISISHTIRKYMGFYVPTVICFLAVLVDFYCLFITILLLRRLNEQTRKRYIFVVVRLSSAILVALCIILIQSMDFWDAPLQNSFTFYAIFFVVYDFSIFSLLGSFTGVAIMTYFGVMRPLLYRDRLTIKVMYILAIGICIIAACLSIPMGLFQAADTVDGPISCDSSSCQIIVKWLLFSLSCIILAGTTATLLFVTTSLYWHAYKSKKMGNLTSSPADHGRARLAWTTALLIILSLVELIPTGLLLAYGKYSISNDCDNFYRAGKLIVPTVISCFETFMGSLTFLLDPFINFFFDRHISKYIGQQMRFLRNKFFSSSSSSSSSVDKEETAMTSDSV